MLLISVILLSVALVSTNAEIIDSEGRDVKGELLKNKITVTIEKLAESVTILPTSTNNPNIGDLIVDNGKQENDTLLYTQIFVNKYNNANDDAYMMKIKETPMIITEIRLMNVGRQVLVSPTYSIIRNGDKSTAQVKFYIKRNEQVRVWVEVYGKNGSIILSSSWMLISLSALFYYVVNKQ